MMPSNTFDKHFQRWSMLSANPDMVKKASCDSLTFCLSENGLLNLKDESKETEYYLHSNTDPLAEATALFEGLSLNDVKIIYVYGVGLGYFYIAAKKWLKSDPERAIAFFEEDPRVLHRFLETEQAHELLFDPQVAVYALNEDTKGLTELNSQTIAYSPHNFIVTTLSKNLPQFLLFKSRINFFTLMNRMGIMEYDYHGAIVFRNFFRNFMNLPRAHLANNLFGQFKGIPAIICGAGPSLDKNIDLLGTLGDRALIFAGGTALNALNSHHVKAHFGVGIDPNPTQFSRLIMNNSYEIPFLYRSRMLTEAIEMIHGDRLYVTGIAGYGVGKLLEEALGIKEIELDEGFNVLNFSIALAHALGCDPIITVGVDLAYSNGRSYAEGVVSHPIHDRQEHFNTKTIKDEVICKTDINGDPVYTLWKWIAESVWYTNFVKLNPGATLINATEGGIGFENIPNLTLKEVADKYFKKTYDLSSILQGEIQSYSFNERVTTEKVYGLIKELLISLRNAVQIINEIINKLKTQENGDSDIQGLEVKLHEERAFKTILEVFDDAFIKMHGLEKLRLFLGAEQLTEEEAKQKEIDFRIKKWDTVRQTALFNATLLHALLTNKEREKRTSLPKSDHQIRDLKQKHPLPTSAERDVYSFENGVLTIIDAELSVNYSAKFIPKEDGGIYRTYYPSGALKIEEYYDNNALHGPSSYYAENGVLLARAWFIEGRREGKAWTYFSDGSVKSLQRFFHGKEHSLQEYFYTNGMPKSFFSYVHGLMDGEVNLYHPNGYLERHLAFKEGKRFGLEQIWDHQGILRIEAHYDHDKPIKTASVWHSNGVLAKKIEYDQNSQCIASTEWDVMGNLIEKPTPKLDYFDSVNAQVSLFTESLAGMVTGISSMNNDETITKELKEDFVELQKQLAQLKSIDQLIKDQTEVDESNPTEELWKTPEIKMFMEQHISRAGVGMLDALKEIKLGFEKMIDQSSKKKDEPEKK